MTLKTLSVLSIFCECKMWKKALKGNRIESPWELYKIQHEFQRVKYLLFFQKKFSDKLEFFRIGTKYVWEQFESMIIYPYLLQNFLIFLLLNLPFLKPKSQSYLKYRGIGDSWRLDCIMEAQYLWDGMKYFLIFQTWRRQNICGSIKYVFLCCKYGLRHNICGKRYLLMLQIWVEGWGTIWAVPGGRLGKLLQDPLVAHYDPLNLAKTIGQTPFCHS